MFQWEMQTAIWAVRDCVSQHLLNVLWETLAECDRHFVTDFAARTYERAHEAELSKMAAMYELGRMVGPEPSPLILTHDQFLLTQRTDRGKGELACLVAPHWSICYTSLGLSPDFDRPVAVGRLITAWLREEDIGGWVPALGCRPDRRPMAPFLIRCYIALLQCYLGLLTMVRRWRANRLPLTACEQHAYNQDRASRLPGIACYLIHKTLSVWYPSSDLAILLGCLLREEIHEVRARYLAFSAMSS